MSKKQVKKLLVVGVDTGGIAKSARKAGYKVYAAGYFGDLDLRRVCSGWEAIVEQNKGESCGKMGERLNLESFLDMTRSLGQKYEIERSLISSGLEGFPEVLSKLDRIVPILGNNPKVMEQVRKKPGFFNQLERLGIPYPETVAVKSLNQAKAAASEMGYPVVVKPIKGFAGAGIRKARNSEQIEKVFIEASSVSKRLLIQRFIEGVHASISFIASDTEIRILTVNEQLLGKQFLFQPEPLGYCGNIVPLYSSEAILKECRIIAEKIASNFNLKGSNGIDLVVSKQGVPYVMEVNPRFQGTLECVERVLGVNIVKSHIDACLRNALPQLKEKTPTFCTRLILYAPKRVVTPHLIGFPEVRNTPLPGTIIERGEPLCSIITEGKSRKSSLRKGKQIAESIYNMLSPA